MRNIEFATNRLESFWRENRNRRVYKKIGIDYNRIVVALEELISQIRLLESKLSLDQGSFLTPKSTFSIPRLFFYIQSKRGN